MRIVFGVLGLVLVLFLVANLAKKELGATHAVALPGATTPAATGAAADANVKQQAQQIEQQYKAALDSAMQQKQPVPDDAK